MATALWLCRGLIEALVLLIVVVSPWALGAAEPEFEFILMAAVAAVVVVWAARVLLEWRVSWKRCPVVLCLAALFLLGCIQLLPVPSGTLSRISPATAQVYAEFLPQSAEVLPFGRARDLVTPPPGTTISVYPGATRLELIRVLAVFLLFAAVRNNLDAATGLRRLCLAAAINGTCLAFFALVQFFTSPHSNVYWTLQSPGNVFGPFINRNHFAFYENVCIGLGVGLLMSGLAPGGGRHTAHLRSETRGLSEVLQSPYVVWILAALALMATSVVFSLSRGGCVAMLAALATCGVLYAPRIGRHRLVIGGVVTLAIALALLSWFGIERVEGRLGTLADADQIEKSRLKLWSRVWPMTRDFLWWGTGYGTFAVIEPLGRTTGDEAKVVYQNAHNEYLEALLEGGVGRLALTLLAIGLILRMAQRATRRHQGRAVSGLAMGGLFSVVSMAVHSVTEFAIHIPAVAVLATVLCAYLAGIGNEGLSTAANGRPSTSGPSDAYVVRLWGIAPVATALTMVLLSVVLVAHGWRSAQSQLLLRIAEYLATEQRADERVQYLEAAAALTPDYARLRMTLAQAHFDLYGDGLDKIDTDTITDEQYAEAEKELNAKHLVPGLRHTLAARDSSPLLGEAHVDLAANASALESGDSPDVYLQRAKRLVPYDAEVWFLFGLQELLENKQDQAWSSFRRSLELSDVFLKEIAGAGLDALGPDELIAKVVPDDAGMLVRVASLAFPAAEDVPKREPFLRKALTLLRSDRHAVGPPEAKDVRLEAVVLQSLGQADDAIKAYEKAIELAPEQLAWRYEFAVLLFEHEKYEQAHRQLRTILGQTPTNVNARRLLDKVSYKLAEKL